MVLSMVNGLQLRGDATGECLELVYAAGFRLTGSHQNAKVLVQKSLFDDENNMHPHPAEALKNLCRVFIAGGTAEPREKGTGPCDTGNPGRAHGAVQEALLALEPEDRMAIVLRENLGLSYTEIAGVTLSTEKEVARRIASARWTLKKLLTPAAV